MISLVWTLMTSCDVARNEVEPTLAFTKIYDDRQFSTTYDPLSVVATKDGGYLTLSSTDQWNIYLLKSDVNGEFAWDIRVPDAYVNPVSGLFNLDDQYYLFCMNEVTLATVVMKIDLVEQSITPVTELDEVQYPLAVTLTDNHNFLVLGYNRKSRSSTLHALHTNFSTNWAKQYSIKEDMEEDIVRHISHIGRRLPFFVGSTPDNHSFYFNGFSNYTLGLNFVSPQSGELTGSLNGFRDDEYISAAYPIDKGKFALARSSYGTSSILPFATVSSASIAASGDLSANNFPEIDTNARIIVHEISYHGKPVVLFGTHTKNQQLVLYAYDKESGEILGSQYLGQYTPYRMGDFASTEDGGLIVFCETLVAGRFSRPCLFKLSADEIAAFIK